MFFLAFVYVCVCARARVLERHIEKAAYWCFSSRRFPCLLFSVCACRRVYGHGRVSRVASILYMATRRSRPREACTSLFHYPFPVFQRPFSLSLSLSCFLPAPAPACVPKSPLFSLSSLPAAASSSLLARRRSPLRPHLRALSSRSRRRRCAGIR